MHTTLFWRPYDVVSTLWTLYGRQNDVVCVLGINEIGWGGIEWMTWEIEELDGSIESDFNVADLPNTHIL